MTMTTDRPAAASARLDTPRPTSPESETQTHAREHRGPRPRPNQQLDDVYRRRRIAVLMIGAGVLLVGLWMIDRQRSGVAPPEPAPVQAVVAAPATTAPPAPEVAPGPDLGALDGITCMLDVNEVSLGDEGDSVACVQIALQAAGLYDGEISGVFDDATAAATEAFQRELDLYVDGIVGKNTAGELGIWPGAEAFIVRTPAPAAGATDLWGMALSSVASAGDDAPPLPDGADALSGKRIVYERAGQRVWAIDGEERVVRSYLVSGSQYRNEVPGIHTVYSKSESALGWDLSADLPYMIRYTQTERGHIGFHAIPSWRDTGEDLQTEAELGQKLSGGCTRQAPLDAQFLWEFADVGTKVIVI